MVVGVEEVVDDVGDVLDGKELCGERRGNWERRIIERIKQ